MKNLNNIEYRDEHKNYLQQDKICTNEQLKLRETYLQKKTKAFYIDEMRRVAVLRF